MVDKGAESERRADEGRSRNVIAKRGGLSTISTYVTLYSMLSVAPCFPIF